MTLEAAPSASTPLHNKLLLVVSGYGTEEQFLLYLWSVFREQKVCLRYSPHYDLTKTDEVVQWARRGAPTTASRFPMRREIPVL